MKLNFGEAKLYLRNNEASITNTKDVCLSNGSISMIEFRNCCERQNDLVCKRLGIDAVPEG